MNPDKQLESSMWIMIILQTIGSVDLPGTGNRKMPSPHQYVSIIVLWSILGLFSGTWQRAAAGLGWLMIVAGMVLGPFGPRAVGFLNSVASMFGIKTPPLSVPVGGGLNSVGKALSNTIHPPNVPSQPSRPSPTRPRSTLPTNPQI